MNLTKKEGFFMKILYYYLFRGNLDTHVQFYQNWVKEANKNGINMKLITFISKKYYNKNINMIKDFQKKGTYIIKTANNKYLKYLHIFIYFFFLSFFSKKIIIHLRKENTKPFDIIKIFKKNVKYVLDFEGDPYYEKEYLEKNFYKEGFYNEVIKSLNKNIEKQKTLLKKSDYIFCVTNKLQKIMQERYPKYKKKFGVLPTGVDEEKFIYNENLRKITRQNLSLENKFVFIFIGNVFYSWQNINKTLKIFKEYYKFNRNAFLVLLIREKDHYIIQDFLKQNDIPKNLYILDSVPNDDVPKYLNAADLGILLRDDHMMNKVASPGKIGEYVACGLPMLITPSATPFSKQLFKNKQAILVNENEPVASIVNKINNYDFTKNERNKLRERNIKYYSTKSYGKYYSIILKKL